LQTTIHKAKDNSFKLILGEHELFAEFLRDFIDIEILKDVEPSDIEDISERFIPLFSDNKDSDTVKRINLKNKMPFFVISIVEHETKVNYRASFKLLQYITLVLHEYEKESNKTNKGIAYTKGFMYPPVLPIVFYDGDSEWTAETNFLHKTEMSTVFEKYIPKFEYVLVKLSKYTIQDLVQFGDTLSLIMIISTIKSSDRMHIIGKLPTDYLDKLAAEIPDHLKKLIADVITIQLTKINVPKDEIESITEKIEQRRFQEMFAIENYDVQETRRIARSEGKAEGKAEGIAEGKIEDVVSMVSELHLSVSEAMRIAKLPESEQEMIISELIKQGVAYNL
jgi:hypothetical protein